LKGYRQWLSTKSYEATASLGGSFYSNNITDYYLTPYDLGYGPFVKFDHDFVGRAALEKMVDNQRRKKVTLVWNGEDIARVFGSLFHAGDIEKYIDLPLANYATLPFDKVLKDGKIIGVSTYTGYTYNERAMLSLGVVDVAYSEPGTQVTLVWGEEGRGSTKADGGAPRASRDPRHGGVRAIRRGGACGIPAALRLGDRRNTMAYIFYEDDLPKLVAVVPGRETHFLRQQGIDEH
jgi:hypothetical protein